MGSEARLAHRSRLLVSIQGNVAVAYCFGTLDRSVVEDLSERARALTFDGVRGLVCSLERVSHIHFQALDSILALHHAMRVAGGRLLLSGASSYLCQILEFGGIPQHVPLLADSNQALECLLTESPTVDAMLGAAAQQSFF
jgi:anti-anti-sigma regulatory factor